MRPFYLHGRPADHHLSKTSPLIRKKDKQTWTSALGHDWMFNAVDVQITKCFFLEGTRATRSCVSTMLCFGVDAVKQKGWTATKKDEKKPNSFFFLFSNLYIECNVRSYQYSTFVSVFHLWVPSGVRGGDANVGCCRFIFYLNIKLIHRSAIFNLAGGKVADVQTFIFLCWVMTVSYWSCYVTLCEDAVQPL